MRHNTQPIDPSGHATEIFADWTIDYLENRAKIPTQPFFLYLAFNAPHFPIEPPAEWLQKVKQRDPALTEARAKNVALVEHLDHHIGRITDKLNQLQLSDNTIVIFTSDNGGSLPHAQNNDPWRDGKQSHYDGGLKIPFVMRWPKGISKATRSDYQGLNFDIYPTLLELAGIEIPNDIDAVSLVPLLRGESMPAPRELYFVRREGGPKYAGKAYEALIYDGWKLMQNDPFSPWELYDLKNDPQEKNNLAENQRQKMQDLSRRIQKHIQRAGNIPWQRPPAKD